MTRRATAARRPAWVLACGVACVVAAPGLAQDAEPATEPRPWYIDPAPAQPEDPPAQTDDGFGAPADDGVGFADTPGFGDAIDDDLGPSSIPGHTVILRGLDKITAETRDYPVPIGETATIGSLEVTVEYCRTRPPEETPETFALMAITERATDGAGVDADRIVVFDGWMFASSPALNPLEHPVYDVWVVGCESANDTASSPESADPTE